MASNYTTNYQLNQWEAGDQVLRTEFNQDNQKIDTALAGLAGQNEELEAALAAAVAGAGNCQMELFTYTWTGTYGTGNSTQIQFAQIPDAFVIVGDMAVVLGRGGVEGGLLATDDATYSGSFISGIAGTWNGSRLSLANGVNARYQMNSKDSEYWVLGLHKKN